MVVGVYGGNPNFVELKLPYDIVKKSSLLKDSGLSGVVGYLVFEGNEKLIAIDGQHRLLGIKQALKENTDLSEEEICVIFIGHSNSVAGLKRTRRLFTTLNRYAKPVSKSEIISLDEDDMVAIITRKLIDEYPIFNKAILIKKGKNIPSDNKECITTIEALFDSLNYFLKLKEPNFNDYKKIRPSEDEISKNYIFSTQLFDLMFNNINSLKDYKKTISTGRSTDKFRNNKGGNLLFRPVGFMIIIKTITHLHKIYTLEEAVNMVAKIPLKLSCKPWSGLLWDSINSNMITRKENQSIAEKLICYSLDQNLKVWWPKENVKSIKSKLAGVLNKEISEVKIEKFKMQ